MKQIRIKCLEGDISAFGTVRFIKGKIYKVELTNLFETSGVVIDENGGAWFIKYSELTRIVPLQARFKEQKIRSRRERLRNKRLRGIL